MNANINNNIRRNIVIKAALIGDTEIGKSSLATTYVGMEYSEYIYPNIGTEKYEKKWILKIKVIK